MSKRRHEPEPTEPAEAPESSPELRDGPEAPETAKRGRKPAQAPVLTGWEARRQDRLAKVAARRARAAQHRRR